MTKAKTGPKLDLEQTFFNVAGRLLLKEDTTEKQAALSTVVSTLLQVLLQKKWRAATIYGCAEQLVASSDDVTRRGVLERTLNVLSAGIPELASPLDLHKLNAGITGVLHDAGFTATEITKLVDDGRGGNTEQQLDRAKSRFRTVAARALRDFWKTTLVKGNPGTPNPR